MIERTAAPAVALLLAMATTGTAERIRAQTDGGRIVAVADIHGALSGLTQILRAAGLVDDRNAWIGGTARLVQTGDFLDRGADVRQVMDLLIRLETEARRAGGRVEVLFGNHEGMNLLHDLRDVAPGAYAAFTDRRSDDRRRRAFDAHAAIARRAGETLDEGAWMAAHPPGFVEYVEALGPGGRYGRWIRSRKIAVLLDGTLFMHAGVPPESTLTLEDINRTLEREIRTWDTLVSTLERQRLITGTFRVGPIVDASQVMIGRIAVAQRTGAPVDDYVTAELLDSLQHIARIETWSLVAPGGPLWYRGLATLPPDAQPGVEALLRRLGAQRAFLGHTPQLQGRVNTRFEGRVILGDTGMLSEFYTGGRPSAVELQGGKVTALYASGREPLPLGEGAPR
jgi:hypothetical protein